MKEDNLFEPLTPTLSPKGRVSKVNTLGKKRVSESGPLLPIDEADAQPSFERRVQKRYTSEKLESSRPYSGRSMIEMLGVLAIIGVLSVGGIAGYSKAMHRYRVNKTIEQITQIAANTRTFFAPQKSYDGLTTSTDTGLSLLKKAGLVPEEMWNGNSLKHPFDGDVSFRSTAKISHYTCFNSAMCNKQAFYIGLSNLPEEACIDLITQDWSNIGVSYIRTFNYQNPTFGASSAPYVVPPVSLDHAIKICEVPATDANGVDSFYFHFDEDITKGDTATSITNTMTTLNGS